MVVGSTPKDVETVKTPTPQEIQKERQAEGINVFFFFFLAVEPFGQGVIHKFRIRWVCPNFQELSKDTIVTSGNKYWSFYLNKPASYSAVSCVIYHGWLMTVLLSEKNLRNCGCR